jgi:hypothetical protein
MSSDKHGENGYDLYLDLLSSCANRVFDILGVVDAD